MARDRFIEECARGRAHETQAWRVVDTESQGRPTVRIQGRNGPRALAELYSSEALQYKRQLNDGEINPL